MSVNPFCSLLQFVYLPIEISSSIFVIPFLLKKKNFWMKELTLGLGIIRLELMTSTTSRWYSTAELYPFPTLIWKENWLINNNLPKAWETHHHYSNIFFRTTWSQTSFFHTTTKRKNQKDWILFWLNPIENRISYWFEP